MTIALSITTCFDLFCETFALGIVRYACIKFSYTYNCRVTCSDSYKICVVYKKMKSITRT